MLQRLFATRAPAETALVRIIVGWVFLSEGIQKFLFPDALGVGRFVKIGIPAPSAMAPFVGVVEIVCGALLVIGLATRPAAIALIVDISVAILSTKLPMLRDKGFWPAMHEARLDLAMLCSLIFLVRIGAGAWSLDARATASG
jgi:putative oxidoreductase